MDLKPKDNFETYFAEKLWEMIPTVYRHEDGLIAQEVSGKQAMVSGFPNGPLRELIELLAGQAAILRRSHDRLWDDQFIEFCCDWAVPYIGDLLGTRMVSALDTRGCRTDVAKTIYYRRRKGTLRILEELISDITDWEGTVVENFRRLGRTRHGLDPHPEKFMGRISSTPPGGTANLRNLNMKYLRQTAFDEYHYTTDMRRHKGKKGRYSITKLAFHIYRLKAYRIEKATPLKLEDGTYSFDPSGREIPLFKPRNRSQDRVIPFDNDQNGIENWEKWRLAKEWELPGEIRCRLLDDIIDKNLLPVSLLIKVTDEVVEPVAGDIKNIDKIPDGKGLLIDPGKGRFAFKDNRKKSESVSYHYGFSGNIGAGTYDRRKWIEECGSCIPFKETDPHVIKEGGELVTNYLNPTDILEIRDSSTYSPINNFTDIENLIIRSANRQRPYLKINTSLVLGTAGKKNATLNLNGLWIGSKADNFECLVLQGDYEKVVISHLTLDPGNSESDEGKKHPYIKLVIKGYVENLVIKDSITGPIETQGNGQIDELTIIDSIIQARDQAIKMQGGNVELKAVTVFGKVDVHRLFATDTIITGKVSVTDIQDGCFRFSAAPIASQLPKPYENYEIELGQRIFASERFGDPEYARLCESAPVELISGAENHLEMGAFNKLRNSVKLASLKAKVDEYMPFGLIPIYIFEN